MPNKDTKVIAIFIGALAALACAIVAAVPHGEHRSANDAMAARVNDAVITEEDVRRSVEAFRSANSLQDDEAWRLWAASEGQTTEDIRARFVGNLVEAEVVEQAAASQGIQLGPDEMSDAIKATKESYAKGVAAAQDEASAQITDEQWSHALSASGYDDDTYRQAVRTALLREHLAERASQDGQTLDEWLSSFVDEQDIEYVDTPNDLSYAVEKRQDR